MELSKSCLLLKGNALDVLRTLPDESIQTVVTSPPYWGLRDYSMCDCSLRVSFLGDEPGIGDRGHSLSARPQEPDPDCPKCHGTGRDESTEVIWGEVEDCEHEWGDKISYKGSRATKGKFCLRCKAWYGQLGLEPTPDMYAQHLVEIFREVRRVLRNDGTFWLNIGDSYAGSGPNRVAMGDLKPKDMVGIPWMVAFALRKDGWWLRSDIIWAKPNPTPSSVQDRPPKSHEYVFLLAKSRAYFYDGDAIKEGPKESTKKRIKSANPLTSLKMFKHDSHTRFGKRSPNRVWGDKGALKRMSKGVNKKTVWEIATKGLSDVHFAVFPEALVEPCVKAGTSEKGACVKCGAPWVRIRENERGWDADGNCKGCGDSRAKHVKGPKHKGKVDFGLGMSTTMENDGAIPCANYVTKGWGPSCDHKDVGLKPCVVLDPFCGSGTAGLVALKLGRNFIGIDVKDEYLKIAERRLSVLPEKLEKWGLETE